MENTRNGNKQVQPIIEYPAAKAEAEATTKIIRIRIAKGATTVAGIFNLIRLIRLVATYPRAFKTKEPGAYEVK